MTYLLSDWSVSQLPLGHRAGKVTVYLTPVEETALWGLRVQATANVARPGDLIIQQPLVVMPNETVFVTDGTRLWRVTYE